MITIAAYALWVLATVLCGISADLVLSAFRRRHAQRNVVTPPELAELLRNTVEFRRPDGWPPLRLGWDVIEAMRVAILVDQFAALHSDDLVYVDLGQARVGLTPAARPDPRDHALHWLGHWDDAALSLGGWEAPA